MGIYKRICILLETFKQVGKWMTDTLLKVTIIDILVLYIVDIPYSWYLSSDIDTTLICFALNDSCT
jgi:hypothetical protein